MHMCKNGGNVYLMKGASTATNAHARETIKNHKLSVKTDFIQNTKIMKILDKSYKKHEN